MLSTLSLSAYAGDCYKVFDADGNIVKDPCSADSYNPAWSQRTIDSIKVAQNLERQTPEYRNGMYYRIMARKKAYEYWIAVKEHNEAVNHPKNYDLVAEFRKAPMAEKQHDLELERARLEGQKQAEMYFAYTQGVREHEKRELGSADLRETLELEKKRGELDAKKANAYVSGIRKGGWTGDVSVNPSNRANDATSAPSTSNDDKKGDDNQDKAK